MISTFNFLSFDIYIFSFLYIILLTFFYFLFLNIFTPVCFISLIAFTTLLSFTFDCLTFSSRSISSTMISTFFVLLLITQALPISCSCCFFPLLLFSLAFYLDYLSFPFCFLEYVLV